MPEPQPLHEIVEEIVEEEVIVEESPPTPPPKVCTSETCNAANWIREQINIDQFAYPYPVPMITKVTNSGIVVVEFTKPLLLSPDKITLDASL